ncbi:MAG: RIP metalloprotease RseP [Candidatus Buchananbacteria bacterium]
MIFTLIAFFVVLSILVLVHEAGHFFTARRFGVKAEEFGLGLPPRIGGVYRDEAGKLKFIGPKKIETKNTIYSLNWIPMGGFVKIKGEEGENQIDTDSFATKKVWQRIIIVSAGVFMNFVLAAVLLTIGLIFGSPQAIEKELPALARVSELKIQVVEVIPASPAAKAEIQVGDSVVAMDSTKFSKIEELQEYVSSKVGAPIKITIKRDQSEMQKEVTPLVLDETKKGGIGVALVQTGFVSYPWYVAWWYGLGETFEMIGSVLYGFYVMLSSLIVSHQVIGEVYGPVGIASLVGDAARMGFLYILQFTAVLSVIIAVINFLPFPALDGGRVFFLIIEAIRRKPVNQKLEAMMHNLGFAFLMILVILVTFRDIARVSSGFLNWWQKITGLF